MCKRGCAGGSLISRPYPVRLEGVASRHTSRERYPDVGPQFAAFGCGTTALQAAVTDLHGRARDLSRAECPCRCCGDGRAPALDARLDDIHDYDLTGLPPRPDFTPSKLPLPRGRASELLRSATLFLSPHDYLGRAPGAVHAYPDEAGESRG